MSDNRTNKTEDRDAVLLLNAEERQKRKEQTVQIVRNETLRTMPGNEDLTEIEEIDETEEETEERMDLPGYMRRTA